jgi:bacterioferritin-associated ferredoxin
MSCNNSQTPSVVNFTLGLGSTLSPYIGVLNVTTKLCTKVCVDTGYIFNPTVSVTNVASLGNNEYMVTLNLQGVYSYTPCGSDCCQCISQVVNSTVNIPLYTTTAPTSVTCETGKVTNTVVAGDCQKCGRYAVSDIVLTITVA